jgi:pyridinium-3,5-biscarboxylic acid mononucleotide sulfurtransferase
MHPELTNKLDLLRARVRNCGSLLVAYSGGVDSALVALVAHRELGGRALACVGVSPSYPARELRAATDLAAEMGFACRVVETHEHANPAYSANAPDRCFFCKVELFERLCDIAAREGWQAVADGVHAADAADHAHGIAAARRNGVVSPLMEAGIDKSEVRTLARELGLPAWDKPAMPCLASRVPHGTPITPALLWRVEVAEDALAALGFRQFRVRHHGELARVELPPEDFARALELREELVRGVRDAGYRFVTIDLAGFRDGSTRPLTVLADEGTSVRMRDAPP